MIKQHRSSCTPGISQADANGLVKLLVTVALTSGDSLDQGNVLRAEGKSVLVDGRKDGAAMNVAQQNYKANMENMAFSSVELHGPLESLLNECYTGSGITTMQLLVSIIATRSTMHATGTNA